MYAAFPFPLPSSASPYNLRSQSCLLPWTDEPPVTPPGQVMLWLLAVNVLAPQAISADGSFQATSGAVMLVPLQAAHSTDVLPLHKQDLGLSRYKWPRTKLNLFSQLYKRGENGSKEGFPSALGQGTEPPRAHTRLLHTERDPSPR